MVLDLTTVSSDATEGDDIVRDVSLHPVLADSLANDHAVRHLQQRLGRRPHGGLSQPALAER